MSLQTGKQLKQYYTNCNNFSQSYFMQTTASLTGTYFRCLTLPISGGTAYAVNILHLEIMNFSDVLHLQLNHP